MNRQSERQSDKPRDHVFDGIFEYDNDLPRWWVVMFIVTIVFSVGYMAWYHLGLFPSASLEAEYEEALATSKAATAAAGAGASAQPIDYKVAAGDVTSMTAAKEVYSTTCAPCHGVAGQGVVGPNLTDDFWIHGPTAAAVETVISRGVLEKGMPAWGEILGPDKVRLLVSYIVSLQGSNPAEPKAPQGDAGKLQ